MIATVLNASSGIATTNEWIATTAGNIANANDTVAPGTAPYRTQTPVLAPIRGGAGTGAGVQVTAVALGPPTGVLAYQPGVPQANAQGVVEYPTDSLVSQLVQNNIASLSFQANAAVLRHAQAAYQSVLAA